MSPSGARQAHREGAGGGRGWSVRNAIADADGPGRDEARGREHEAQALVVIAQRAKRASGPRGVVCKPSVYSALHGRESTRPGRATEKTGERAGRCGRGEEAERRSGGVRFVRAGLPPRPRPAAAPTPLYRRPSRCPRRAVRRQKRACCDETTGGPPDESAAEGYYPAVTFNTIAWSLYKNG